MLLPLCTSMISMRIGYFSGAFGDLPFKKAMEALARIGYDGVELCTWKGYPADLDTLSKEGWKKIEETAGELGLMIPAVGHGSIDCSSSAEARRGGVERTYRNVDFAATVGARVVDVTTGMAPPGMPEADAWRFLTEGLSECADYAMARGCVLGLEPHINTIIDAPDKVLRAIDAVRSKALGVNLDASHFAVLGFDVLSCTRELARYTVHTHLKDTRGRYPSHEFLIPGEGAFPTLAFIKTLREVGYDGFITAEVAGMRRQMPGYQPVPAAQIAYETVFKAFRELGLR